MATLANLNVLIGSDVSGLTRGLRTADKKTRGFSNAGSRYMQQFARGTGGAVRKVVNLRSAIGILAGSAGLGLLVAKQLQSIDSTAKFADMIGESTKELVGLQHAAEITAGVTSSQFNMALQRMTRRTAEAANGTGEAKDAIKQLGLDAQELNRIGPAAAFQKISGAMQQIDNQGERVRIAFKLFDSEGAKLVNTLNAGPEAIRELVSEADRLGKSFTRIDAAKVEAANDAITRAQGAFSGVARTLTVELAPYIEAVANEFVNASKQANGFRDTVIGAAEGSTRAVGFLGDMLRGIRVVVKIVELGFASFAEGMYVTILQIVDGLRDMANVIPGINIGPLEGLESVTRAATARTNKLKGELRDLVNEPMPGEKIDAFFKNVKAGAQEAASAVAESKRNMAGGVVDSQGQPANDEDKTKLEQIRESFLSEQELEREQFEQKREFLLNANDKLFDDELTRKQALEQLEAQHQDRLNKIKYKGLDQEQKLVAAFKKGEYKIAADTGQKILAAASQQNKTLFKVTKAAALARAVVSLPSAVMQSFDNAGGYPWGLIPAGLMLATGLSQINAIKSSSYGGGGGAGSISSGGASTPSPSGGAQTAGSVQSTSDLEDRDPQKQLIINLPEDDRPVSKGWVRDNLMPTIKDAQKDGYILA